MTGLRRAAPIRAGGNPISRITVTNTRDRSEHHFDDSELNATSSAELTADGEVIVAIDLYRGAELIATVPAERFAADDVDGFSES